MTPDVAWQAHGRPSAGKADCPYRGLAPFSEKYYEYFFGRKVDTSQIAASAITDRLVVLFGPSGVGKSSIVATALPRALNSIIDGTLVVPHHRWEPGFYGGLLDKANGLARSSADSDGCSLEKIARRWNERQDAPIVFVFDQFEQYFLSNASSDAEQVASKEAFEADLARTVHSRDLDAHVLISIREDALHELENLRDRLPGILSDPIRLDHLDHEGAQSAIREPLQVFRRHFGDEAGPTEIEDALVCELLAKACRSAEPKRYETPYLQLVLERLWNEEHGEGSRVLRFATYDRLHQWEGIANSHVSQTLETVLSEDDRALCAKLFDRMVTPSGMKITLSADDLAEMARVGKDEAKRVEQVLGALGKSDSRIIRSVTVAQDPTQKRYEIFHDVLARPILAWKQDFDAEQEQQRLREEAAQEIEKQKRQAAAQKRRAKRAVIVAWMITGLAVLTLVLGAMVVNTYREAAEQTSRILAVRANLATDQGDSRTGLLLALEALPENEGLIESVRRPTTAEAREALERVLFRPFGYILSGHSERIATVVYSPDGTLILTASEDRTARLWQEREDKGWEQKGQPLKHEEEVTSAVFSRDSRFIVTASDDGKGYIWKADDGTRLTEWQVSPQGGRTIVGISRDNRHLAALALGDTARVWTWDPKKPAEPPLEPAELPHDRANFVAFDPDGRRVVTTSWAGNVRIWDVETKELVAQLQPERDDTGRCIPSTGHCGAVLAAAFSPSDSNQVVTASADERALVWDLRERKVLRSLKGHDRAVSLVAFSKDGSEILTTSLDGTVRIWSARTGDMLQVLLGPTIVGGMRASAALSPDGDGVVASFANNWAHVWKLRPDLQPQQLLEQAKEVPVAALGPDDRLLVTANGYSIDFYDALSGTPRTPTQYRQDKNAVMSLAVNPNGKDLMVAAGTGVKVYDIDAWLKGVGERPPEPIGTFGEDVAGKSGGRTSLVHSAVYSPSGDRIVTASQDGTARIWDAGSGKPVGQPLRHGGAVLSAAFDRAGERVLTGSFDGTVRIWNARDSAPARALDVGSPVMEAAFAPDGPYVVVTTLEVPQEPVTRAPFFQTKTSVWSLEEKKLVEGSELENVRLLPLTNYVVVGTENGSIRLRTLDGEPMAILPDHLGRIQRVVASPSGERLVTVSADGSVRVWKLPPTDTHRLVAYAKNSIAQYFAPAQRELTVKERKIFGLSQRPLPLGEWLRATAEQWLGATLHSMTAGWSIVKTLLRPVSG